MKVYFYALMAMSLITTQINADEPATDSAEKVDEIVVTSVSYTHLTLPTI